MTRTALILVCAFSWAYAVTAVQDDWSGGPREPGPVGDFGLFFSFGSNIVWQTPGVVTVSSEPLLIPVDELFAGASCVVPTDIDGDGDMDLAGSNMESDEIAWWQNTDGTGLQWRKIPVFTGFVSASALTAADMDGDGDMDLVGAAKDQYGDKHLALFTNLDGAGESWSYIQVSGSFPGAHAVCTGDIDGDGDPDMASVSIYQDKASWWENRDGAGGEWVEHPMADSLDGAWTLTLADLDGDGDLDAAAGAYYANDVVWLENTGSPVEPWTRHNIDTDLAGIYYLDHMDMDGDGDTDLLGAAANADRVVWWENTRDTFVGHMIDPALDGAVSVHGCDMDGDGIGEVLAASVFSGQVVLYRNEPDGWKRKFTADGFTGAFSVTASDIDSDGIPDVIAAAQSAGLVAWWNRAPEGGYLESSILYTGGDPMWGTIDWTSEAPEGTSVTFQVRSSDDPESMGEWSEPLLRPGRLSDFLTDDQSFMQYRALLQGSGQTEMPYLHRVEITWINTGIEEEGAPVPPTTPDLWISPNPSVSVAVIGFFLAEESPVEMAVFDVAGRLVWRAQFDELSEGVHTLTADGLAPGMYLCRMTAADFRTVERFAVVR